MSNKDFDDLLDELEDKSEAYDWEKPSVFEDKTKLRRFHKALERIAKMRAAETSCPSSFKSEQEYKAHKQELNEREIVELLKVRDCNPEMIDSLIEKID